MKKISKLRLYHAASSGFVLAIIPAFLIITFIGSRFATHPAASIFQLTIYFTCFLVITLWIYSSDSEFQIYYCPDCLHEWPKKKHNGESCPKCSSRKFIYNYKP